MVLLTEVVTVPIQAVNLESDQVDVGSGRIGDLDRIKALINIVEDYLVFQKKISSKEIGFVPNAALFIAEKSQTDASNGSARSTKRIKPPAIRTTTAKNASQTVSPPRLPTSVTNSRR